jgi:hypothetical protein
MTGHRFLWLAEISRFAESLNEEFRNKSQLVEKYFRIFHFGIAAVVRATTQMYIINQLAN